MSNVVSIKGDDRVLPGRPNQDCIDVLEEILEKARSGEMCDVAVAWVSDARHGIFASYHGQTQFARLVGAVAMLQHDLLSRQDVDRD